MAVMISARLARDSYFRKIPNHFDGLTVGSLVKKERQGASLLRRSNRVGNDRFGSMGVRGHSSSGPYGELQPVVYPRMRRVTGQSQPFSTRATAALAKSSFQATRPESLAAAWCVSNAKVELKGNGILITKQASAKAKIDPLMALRSGRTM